MPPSQACCCKFLPNAAHLKWQDNADRRCQMCRHAYSPQGWAVDRSCGSLRAKQASTPEVRVRTGRSVGRTGEMTAHQYFMVAGPMLLSVVTAGLVTIIIAFVFGLRLLARAVRALEVVARREQVAGNKGVKSVESPRRKAPVMIGKGK